jgi:hypothetical protein
LNRQFAKTFGENKHQTHNADKGDKAVQSQPDENISSFVASSHTFL